MATYLEIANLQDDMDFRKRVRVAVVKYAAYIMGQPATEPFREQRVNWSRRALQNPDEQVYRLLGFILGDGQVQDQLAAISDATLQGITEWHINQNMPVLV